MSRVKKHTAVIANHGLRQLQHLIASYEKVILALLAIVIVVSGSYWFNQYSVGGRKDSVVGGTYVEGIIGGQEEMQMITARLTKTGLFRFDNDGQLKPSLIENWSVNADLTEYRFRLRKEINGNEIIEDFKRSGSLLGSPEVLLESNNELLIKLKEPNPNVPILLTQPMFRYGAYRINKISERSVIFSRNTREGAIKAFINKIIIYTFDSKEELNRVLQKRRLDGAQIEIVPQDKNYIKQEIAFPRFVTLLFNTNKTPFRDANARRALIDTGTANMEPFTLTVPDKETYHSIARSIVERWQNNGIEVNLEFKSVEEIINKIGPGRTFQAMITTIDYGAEYDPYLLWHSTQVRLPGLNVTGVRDSVVDSLIERLRSTYNIAERRQLVEALHNQLHDLGVAKIIKQETESFVISQSIRYQPPWVSISALDRFQAITRWSVL